MGNNQNKEIKLNLSNIKSLSDKLMKQKQEETKAVNNLLLQNLNLGKKEESFNYSHIKKIMKTELETELFKLLDLRSHLSYISFETESTSSNHIKATLFLLCYLSYNKVLTELFVKEYNNFSYFIKSAEGDQFFKDYSYMCKDKVASKLIKSYQKIIEDKFTQVELQNKLNDFKKKNGAQDIDDIDDLYHNTEYFKDNDEEEDNVSDIMDHKNSIYIDTIEENNDEDKENIDNDYEIKDNDSVVKMESIFNLTINNNTQNTFTSPTINRKLEKQKTDRLNLNSIGLRKRCKSPALTRENSNQDSPQGQGIGYLISLKKNSFVSNNANNINLKNRRSTSANNTPLRNRKTSSVDGCMLMTSQVQFKKIYIEHKILEINKKDKSYLYIKQYSVTSRIGKPSINLEKYSREITEEFNLLKADTSKYYNKLLKIKTKLLTSDTITVTDISNNTVLLKNQYLVKEIEQNVSTIEYIIKQNKDKKYNKNIVNDELYSIPEKYNIKPSDKAYINYVNDIIQVPYSLKVFIFNELFSKEWIILLLLLNKCFLEIFFSKETEIYYTNIVYNKEREKNEVFLIILSKDK